MPNIQPTIPTSAAFVIANGTTAATLPTPAVLVTAVSVVEPGTNAVVSNYAVVAGTPAAGQVQFAGTPGAPSATLTFATAPPSGSLIAIDYVPVGGINPA